MTGDHNERLQRIIRGVTTGTDPARLLNEVLVAALTAARGNDGLLMGVVDGDVMPLATSGTPSGVLLDAAEGAISTGRLTRRTAKSSSDSAAAEPLRVGDRVVGALAVSGEPFSIDLTVLPLYGSVAALVLGRRPAPASGIDSGVVLDALATLYTEPDQASVMVHLFDAAEQLFGSRGGFCALQEGDSVRIAHHRGIDRERIRDASRHPDFAEMVTSPALRVDDAGHPVIARLVDGLETAVGLPLSAGGRRLGHLVLLLGEAPDSTARALLHAFGRHAALALRAADLYADVGDTEERLAAIVYSMPNPVVVVDEDACFSVVNAAAATTFSLSETFEIGQPVGGRLHHAGLEAMLTGAREGQLELVLGSPAASVYRATVRRVIAPDGRSLGRVLVLDDITAEREMEQIKNDFVSVIGHELRTPITIVKSSARALERKADEMSESSRRRTLESLTRGVSRLERLVEDLLLVSAVEQNTAKLERETVDLGPMVDEFASERVAVRRPRRIDAVHVDAGKIRQVIHHLVDNALKYSEEEVLIEVADSDEELQVTVTDKGPGIYSGDIPFLFERFKQLDGTATRAHGGTGLGLFLCRRLVEAHGGRIWCESRLEVGSRFHFTLPHQNVTAWSND